MTKRLSVREVRANLADVLGEVFYTQQPVVVERKGRPVAVLISPDQYQRLQEQEKGRFFEAVHELQQRNEDKDPDEILRDVTSLVEEVRRERYEREQRGE